MVALQGAVGCLGCLVGGAVLDACVKYREVLLIYTECGRGNNN